MTQSDPELQRRAEALFLELVDVAPEGLSAALDDRCGQNAVLRRELESLLAAHASAQPGMLDTALFVTPASGESVPGAPGAGQTGDDGAPFPARIGAYTILGLLGAGGMGAVYKAEQERPRRIVALKVIRPGLATPSMLRRFENEAEALGRLHHPGIAQIFEAGTADTGSGPQPFFAMELAAGKPITQYAEERRLGYKDRMALLALVCDAVQHAHQRGVIHRDLKPGNILVDDTGQPKTLDFGVARLASDAPSTTIETSVGQLIGTLPYMSPEQIAADPDAIDTRTDVYALGVILYQLLTGRLPHAVHSKSIPEAARVIRDEAPARLSSVSRVFRGEVDTIVAKALEKDKERRYQSASDLADDIRRHLAGEPIAARRDSVIYVLRKQARKHRVAAATAMVVVGLVLAFAAVSAWQAGANSRLARQERSARIEADRARDTAREEQRRADVERERLRRGLYFSSIGFAQAAYASHDTESMRRRLEECPEDLRNWEWAYLAQLVDDSDRSVDIHEGNGLRIGPSTLATDAASTTLMTFDLSKRAILWDVVGGRRSRELDWPEAGAWVTATLSPDGRRVFSAADFSDDMEVRAHDVATASLLWATRLPKDALSRIYTSGDGRRVLATGIWGLHAVLDAETGAEIARCGEEERLWTAHGAISPDGAMVAAISVSGDLRVWDTPTGELIGSIPSAHRFQGRALAFSPDGARLASAGADGVVRVWDSRTMRAVMSIRAHENKVWCLAWSPDGKSLASAGTDTTIVLTDVATGDRVASLHGHAVTVASLEFTRDGAWLISSSRDGVLKWWRIPPRPAVGMVEFESRTAAIATHEDACRFAVGAGSGELAMFDAGAAAELWRKRVDQGEVWGVAFSPDGSLVYTGGLDGVVRAWDVATAEPRAEAPLDSERIYRLAVARDGRVAAACGGGVVAILPPGLAGAPLKIESHEGFSTAVAWSPDGSMLATGGQDGALRLWNPADGAFLRSLDGHAGHVYSALWSHDGAVLFSASEDWTIRVWDPVEGREVGRLAAHGGPVYCVALNPEGNRLISGSFDNNIKVWDVLSGRDILTLRGHLFSTTSVAFAGNGAWILSGNDDGTVRLWGFPRGLAPAPADRPLIVAPN